MTHLRLHETPKLGVHQTGSSSDFGQTPFNKLALKIRKLGLEQAPVAGDIIAMGSQAGNVFVHHRRHP
jgi:hypothetical protein